MSGAVAQDSGSGTPGEQHLSGAAGREISGLEDSFEGRGSGVNPAIPVSRISDLWFLPRAAWAPLAKQPVPLVQRGECSEPLKVAKEFREFIKTVLPDAVPSLPVPGLPGERAQGAAGGAALSAGSPESLGTEIVAGHQILSATLFLRLEDDYLQIQATWNQNVPSSYTLRALAFDNPALEGTPRVRAFEFLDTSRRYDLVSVREIFRKLSELTTEGAVLAQQVADFDGRSRRVVRFFGSLPVSYDGPQESCSLDFATNRAICDCRFR